MYLHVLYTIHDQDKRFLNFTLPNLTVHLQLFLILFYTHSCSYTIFIIVYFYLHMLLCYSINKTDQGSLAGIYA